MVEGEPRPSPDELLARVKAEEKQQKRGKLKIFLGYAPGVGKTYTMLEAARLRAKESDVIIAWVETHGRPETEALLNGLTIVPPREIEYHGTMLAEMDIDAVMQHHPQLAIVDELAHENIPGSRHVKRYQDVDELLEAGIDVYTTLNIQHIESARDVVAQVTSVWIRETVPDRFVDNANEIELVDLPPEELLVRLKEGKVYVPEQVVPAAQNFFRKGNLMALRELTLRTGARHVDEQTLAYMKAHAIRGPWSSGERILLYIGPGSSGASLVRNARRLAYELGAEWTAIHVETLSNARASSEQQDRITDSLRLAQRLGAKTLTLQGESVVRTVVDYAIANNFTKIVIVKPPLRRFRNLFNAFVATQIIRQSRGIDVHLVSIGNEPIMREKQDQAILGKWGGYIQALVLVAIATVIGKLAQQFFAPANMIMVYLLCVVATAFLWGYGPSILVSIVSVLVFDFGFIPPVLTFTVFDTKYIFTLFVLLIVGLAISYLVNRIRDQAEAAKRREQETSALYDLSRDLAISTDLESYITAIIRRIKETIGNDAILFLPDPDHAGELIAFTGSGNVEVDENEKAAATWSFEHQKTVGYGTDTLPNSHAIYLPLVTARGTIGVLGLLIEKLSVKLTVNQERLLEAYADLAAVSIESIRLGEEAHHAKVLTQVLNDTEKLQTAILNSISHDLRTPLVSIIGTLSSLQEERMVFDDAAKKNMIQVAREEAERLNQLISNLLDLSRLEAGALKITRQPAEIQDLVGSALEQLGDRVRGHPIKTAIPENLPFISVDFSLVVQVLVNILDNALKYSPADSLIEISSRESDQEVIIEIADRGIGISPQDLPHIFDKFYQIERPGIIRSTGLGLSICKGIIEAHNGRIRAKNRDGGGTVIQIELPQNESSQNNGSTTND
jgi:two-component system, OmpR family, sensor histidine kinase KdpD